MSNNSNNFHFSGESLICNPYVIIIVPRFVRVDNDKIRAAIESSAIKMNIIVILSYLKLIKIVYGMYAFSNLKSHVIWPEYCTQCKLTIFKWEVFEAGLTILNGKQKAFDYYVPGKRCSHRV